MSAEKLQRKINVPGGVDERANSGGTKVKTVSTAAELQNAIADQVSGQTIRMLPGTYTLTAQISIPLAASGGRLEAPNGGVSIIGAASVDSAFLINPAVSSATFEYTMAGIGSIKGGANKIGIKIANTAITKKVLLMLNDCYLEDNGTGAALSAVNTDGSNAIRIYMTGGAVDSVDFVPKDNGDRMYFTGVDIDQAMDVTAVDVTAEFKFKDCKLPHALIRGGHANNICNVINCYTIETTAAAAADASDFPDAFNPTIVA
jgi:hypothetical protein